MSFAGELSDKGAKHLQSCGIPEPELTSELLLSHLLGKQRLWLKANSETRVSPQQENAFSGMIKKRADGMPMQYITGEQLFLGYKIKVNPSVLIPRPETEVLAELAIEQASKISNPKILDLCTGSGCIACALAMQLPNVTITASDISAPALETAKENSKVLGLEGRIHFVLSDIFSNIAGKFDIITANPPYIKSCAQLPEEVKAEPAIALYAGKDGMDIIRQIIKNAPGFLNYGGKLFIEIDSGQGEELGKIATANFADMQILQDINNIERYFIARLNRYG